MTERPILFTPELAQKVFDGVKTQTRRLNGLDEINQEPERYRYRGLTTVHDQSHAVFHDDRFGHQVLVKCPYGVVGDLLWCRENGWERPERTPKMLRDGADTWEPFYFDALLDQNEAEELKEWGFKRRPSIFMPRWACRTVVELTEVRVERVQEITEDDAKAEGCAPVVHEDGAVDCGTRKTTFRQLWQFLHGPYSWQSNPWCWVLSFRRTER